jgi:hypothetical protein
MMARYRKPTVAFRSKAQARFMFSQHPDIAKTWVNRAKRRGVKHPIKGLPNKVTRRRKRG